MADPFPIAEYKHTVDICNASDEKYSSLALYYNLEVSSLFLGEHRGNRGTDCMRI
jgi:hypothetical protein